MSAPEPSNGLEPENASPMDITYGSAVNTTNSPPFGNDRTLGSAIDNRGLTNDEVDVVEPENASPMDITAESAVNTTNSPPFGNDRTLGSAIDNRGLTNDEVDVVEPDNASLMDITAELAVNTTNSPPFGNDRTLGGAVDNGGLTNDEVDGTNPHGTGGLLPASFWQHAQDQQEEREAADDNDSALGDNDSWTDSVTSSILDYVQLHGRTYHSRSFEGAQYWGSNDEKHVEALDINHLFLTKLFDNKLHFAPIDDNIQRVLDVGTGSGKWAIEFADSHEGVEVTGTDLSPMQPQWVPTNLKFEIEDCTADWTFTPASFDFIHMRFLVGSIQNWTELFRQAYAATKPGGWVESGEGSPHMRADNGSVPDRSAISQWGKFFEEGGAKMGRSFLVVEEGTQRRAMEQAGFVDIGERDFKAPVGGWPEDEAKRTIGQLSQAALEYDIEGYVLFIANVLAEWSREEILVYIAQLRREIRSGKHHASFRVKSVWGRRPF